MEDDGEVMFPDDLPDPNTLEVGSNIAVYCPPGGKSYPGVVQSIDTEGGKHAINYLDSDTELSADPVTIVNESGSMEANSLE